MEINEFKQVLKNNISELIALQEQCQNTDVIVTTKWFWN